MTFDPKVVERFWSKVDKTADCWVWTAGIGGGGYGLFHAGRHYRAHRFSFEANFGAIPQGLCVCHRCDNRLCVRPEHLFVGTYADNLRDMREKGRAHFQVNRGCFLRGEKSPRAKLTNQQAVDLRVRYVAGESARALGSHFGMTESAVFKVLRGEVYAQATGGTSVVRGLTLKKEDD